MNIYSLFAGRAAYLVRLAVLCPPVFRSEGGQDERAGRAHLALLTPRPMKRRVQIHPESEGRVIRH